MGFIRLPINTLSGGVGRQAPTKRLVSEAENIDNCLVTLEKSVEKRPPLTKVEYTLKDGSPSGSSYLPVQNVDPPSTFDGGGSTNFNPDNLYFHYLDIDGFNRYCIIINRANYLFDPTVVKKFNKVIGGVTVTINLSNFITVFRIEPTEWIEEEVDSTQGFSGNTSGFNRGIFEYITFGNKNTTTQYQIANQSYSIAPTPIEQTFGSMDFDVGFILWNKLIPVDYLPNNASQEIVSAATWAATLPNNELIHSGDAINYKITIPPNSANPSFEDDISSLLYWTNVRDNIDYVIDPVSAEETEVGQSVENFSIIPQYPASEVQADVQDANGFKAWRMLHHYYDSPRLIPTSDVGGSLNFALDHYHQSSPLPAVDRDGSQAYLGKGKVYTTRSSYLTFPTSFYRATRFGKNPYFERLRTEDANSVFDHRRLPIIIYKDTATDGKWRVKHMPVLPRRSGTPLSNPGPKAFERKERIQSMAIWKNRLWIATDNTLLASRTNNYYNFWVDDVLNVVETDPIDIQSSVGAYNKLSYIVPFQSILFVSSSGSVQFEVRGGSIDTGISPFNVELRPTSFYSTSRLIEPQKMGNNIFFMDSGRMYMYLSGSSFNDEYSTSMDLSTHCKGYLPTEFGAVTTNSAVNSIMFVDANQTNNIYFFTFRSNGDNIIQNSFYRWILSSLDNVRSMKAYEKDLYIVSKRNSVASGPAVNKLVVYFSSLEAVPVTTPMVDWLTTVVPAKMTFLGGNTTMVLSHFDPEVKYVIKCPGNAPAGWDNVGTSNSSYSITEIPTNAITTTTVGGQVVTQFTVSGNFTTANVFVGRSYEMNVELSQQVPRTSESSKTNASVMEGVMNMKKITLRHLNTGAYDVVIERRGRLDNAVTFIPTDANSLLSRLDQLKIDVVGEHTVKVLSYSEACKLFIKSSYPTPCNISNIEIVGNYRIRNTSIE